MDRLWSPWRLEYVARGQPDMGCIFCKATRPPESDALVLFEGRTSYVILNLYPYNNGHLMVVPYRHVAAFASLELEEITEIGVLVQRAETALTEAYRPHGFNVGVNLGRPAGAGVADHLHVHMVPRWNGDTNFMTVAGNMRVLPENIGASAERLRPIFERLSRS